MNMKGAFSASINLFVASALLATTTRGIVGNYTRDLASNRDSRTVGNATTNHTYNALDQLISAGSITYGYDGRGNQTQITNGSNVTTYTYNAADQLTNVSATGVNATYVYNADGKRVKQTLGSTVTNFLWDEASPYGDVVFEYNGSGSTLASYVLGGTGLISQNRSGVTNYYLQDGQGSTRGLTSTTGTVTDTYSYTAFGELFAPGSSGTTVNPYRYTGQQFDSLTGLYSLRARYYNPALGRFLTQDTYPVNFGNPIELNRYVYVANSPINLMDPSGHEGMVGQALFQRTANIGSASLPAIAVYTSAIVLGIVLGMLLSEVEAPPHSITWQELYKNVRLPNPGSGNEPSGDHAPGWIIGLAVFVLCLTNPDLCIPDPGPQAPPTETSEPEFIYKEGKGPKAVQLHRDVDYRTGLSFYVWNESIIIPHVKFRTSTLEARGYIVKPDGDSNPVTLPMFGGGPAFPGSESAYLPYNHVTVYHPDGRSWTKWHLADRANLNTERNSPELLAFYSLHEE